MSGSEYRIITRSLSVLFDKVNNVIIYRTNHRIVNFNYYRYQDT